MNTIFNMKRKRSTIWQWCMVCIVSLISFTVQADDIRKLIPGDVGVYIEVNKLNGWLDELEMDPLWQMIKQATPARTKPQEWKELLKTLEMTEDQLVRKYFGNQLVIAGLMPGDNQPAVIMLKVDEKDFNHAVSKIKLVKQDEPGDFVDYVTPDGQGLVGFRDGYVLLSDVKFRDYYQKMATFKATPQNQSLKQNARFNNWLKKIKANPTVLVYALDERNPEKDTHIGGLTHEGLDITMQYVGTNVGIRQGLGEVKVPFQKFQPAPLPDDIVAMMMLNATPPIEQPERLNAIIEPLTVEKDIKPNLTGPVTLFMADSNKMTEMPTVGMTVKIKDEVVANAFSTAISKAVVAMNLGLVNMGVKPMTLVSQVHQNHIYYSLNIGSPMSQLTNYKRLDNISWCFGYVDGHYVMTSNIAVMNECIERGSKPIAGLEVMNVEGRTPLAFGQINGVSFAEIFNRELLALQKHLSENQQLQQFNLPVQEEFIKQIGLASKIIAQHEKVTIELSHDADQNIYVESKIIRKK